jgi:hypothetical protein
MSLSSGSIGSHRAFMRVCVTLCICLMLTLYVGWRWYFENLAKRQMLIDLAQEAEMRKQGLEKMGLSVEEARSEIESPSVMPKIAGPEIIDPPKPAPPRNETFPANSSIEEIPLMESSEEVTQALALLDQYWKTQTWQDKVPMVVQSDRVSALMKDFYEVQKGSDPMPGGMIGKARYMIDSTEILYFSYTSSRPNGTLEVAMLRGSAGVFLVDWESLTGYGEMSFREFRAQRPTKPVTLRAYARLFEYFNFEFSDSSKYLCVKLTSENGESSIYAYCKRGTQIASLLETDLAGTGPTAFKGYTVQVSFPPNALSNQCVNLDKILRQRWLSVP